VYVQRNIEALSCNQCCSGKACVFSLSYPACNVHAPYFHLWPARLCSIFSYYLTKGTIFGKMFIEHKMYFDFLCNICLKLFSFEEEVSKMITNVYRSSCKVLAILVKFYETWIYFNEAWIFFWQIFEKYSNIKFHENPSIGNLVVPCGRTDRRIDITKLIVALRNFANAPKNRFFWVLLHALPEWL
jgi:hypothetical protein